MLTSGLFVGYTFGFGAIVYNISRMKIQDDYESDLRDLREYDVSHEPINVDKDLPAKCMILVKHHPTEEDTRTTKSSLIHFND